MTTATASPPVPQRPTFTVPAGDPAELFRAATRAAAEADRWHTAGQTVRTAARTAQNDWQGTAQTAFGDYTERLASAHATNGAAIDQAAQALRQLSGALNDAQQTGQRATRAWLDAHTRLAGTTGTGAAATRARQSAQDDLDQASSLGARAQSEYEQNAAQATQRLQNATDQLTPVPALRPELPVTVQATDTGQWSIEHPDSLAGAPGGSEPAGRRSAPVITHVDVLPGGNVIITMSNGKRYQLSVPSPFKPGDFQDMMTNVIKSLRWRTPGTRLGYRWVEDDPGTIVGYRPDGSAEQLPEIGSEIDVIRYNVFAVGTRGEIDTADLDQQLDASLAARPDEISIVLEGDPSAASQEAMIAQIDRYLAEAGVTEDVSFVVPGAYGIMHESWRAELGADAPRGDVNNLGAGEAGAMADEHGDPLAGRPDPAPDGAGSDGDGDGVTIDPPVVDG